MNLVSALKTLLRGNGYDLASRVYGNSIYLREIDQRYAFGFVISEAPKQVFPSVSVGVLDRSVHTLISEIEKSQHIGLYGLTFYRELVANDELTSNEPKGTVADQILEKVERYIRHFSELDDKIVKSIEASIAANTRPDFFLPGVGQPILFDVFPYIHLVCLMASDDFRSTKDIQREINLIESGSSIDPLLQHRLSLLSQYLEAHS